MEDDVFREVKIDVLLVFRAPQPHPQYGGCGLGSQYLGGGGNFFVHVALVTIENCRLELGWAPPPILEQKPGA